MSGEHLRQLRRAADQWSESSDAFGRLIADGTTNRGDLASHFRFTPESYRYYRNGSRVALQYDSTFRDTNTDSTGTFDDSGDTYTLSPDADDTLILQSAERFRYVVAYESEFSQAWKANRSLEGDEAIRIYFDGAEPDQAFGRNSHGIEYDANGARQFIEREGSRVREQEVNPEPITTWSIYQNIFNWYNVGQKRGSEIYAEGDAQQETDLGTISTDRTRGPKVGNGRITVEVDAGSATDLTVDVGSTGFKNLGQVTAKTRQKTFEFDATVSTAGEYVPVAALRLKDGYELVTADVLELTPITVQGSTTFLIQAIDDDNTDASGFSDAPETNPVNNAVGVTTSVSTFPDSSGTEVSSATDPGGYQLAYSNSQTTGKGSGTTTVSEARERRRRLHDMDVAVVLANAASTGDLEFTISTEQEF